MDVGNRPGADRRRAGAADRFRLICVTQSGSSERTETRIVRAPWLKLGYEAFDGVVGALETVPFNQVLVDGGVFDRQGVYKVFGSTPASVGKTVFDIPGLDGRHVIAEGFAAAQAGGGWIDYEVLNPTNGVVDAKTSFILPLGADILIGCGVFQPKGGFKLARG